MNNSYRTKSGNKTSSRNHRKMVPDDYDSIEEYDYFHPYKEHGYDNEEDFDREYEYKFEGILASIFKILVAAAVGYFFFKKK